MDDEQFLQKFYNDFLLPEFGIENNVNITWEKHEWIGPDDSAHYFSIRPNSYALIFRDYGVFTDEELKKLIKLPKENFEYVNTISGNRELHSSVILPRENKYIPHITGMFVLLKCHK